MAWELVPGFGVAGAPTHADPIVCWTVGTPRQPLLGEMTVDEQRVLRIVACSHTYTRDFGQTQGKEQAGGCKLDRAQPHSFWAWSNHVQTPGREMHQGSMCDKSLKHARVGILEAAENIIEQA